MRVNCSILIGVAGVMLAGTAAAQTTPSPPEREQITVYGVADVSAVPDVATASFAVTREAKTSREALNVGNKAMSDVVEALKQLGIEARDLRTSGFSVTPQYRYGKGKNGQDLPPTIIGYEVANTLAVRVRDIGKLDDVLDGAVTLGATSNGSIAFAIDDPAALRVEARKKAMADAKANAEALASSAGVSLGRALRIDVVRETRPAYYAGYDIDAAYGAYQNAQQAMSVPTPRPSVPIETGDQTVSAEVMAVFAIEPPR